MKLVKKPQGFSLIEIMIGIVLFLTAFIMIIGIFPVSFNSVQMAKNELVATHIAEERVEYVKSLPYEDITVDNLPNGSYVFYCEVNGVTQDLSYSYSYVITADTPSADIKNIRVTVQWEHGGRVSYVVMETNIADI